MCWRPDCWAGLEMEGGTFMGRSPLTLCGRGFMGRGLNRSEGEWSEGAWLATRYLVEGGLGAGPEAKAEPNGLGAGPG